MKFKINNLIKIYRSILNHLKLVSVLISLIIIISIGVFLYRNFYLTIISAKKIIILQQDISVGKLNIALLEKIENNYQNKLNLVSPQYITIPKKNLTNESRNTKTDNNDNPQPKTSF